MHIHTCTQCLSPAGRLHASLRYRSHHRHHPALSRARNPDDAPHGLISAACLARVTCAYVSVSAHARLHTERTNGRPTDRPTTTRSHVRIRLARARASKSVNRSIGPLAHRLPPPAPTLAHAFSSCVRACGRFSLCALPSDGWTAASPLLMLGAWNVLLSITNTLPLQDLIRGN